MLKKFNVKKWLIKGGEISVLLSLSYLWSPKANLMSKLALHTCDLVGRITTAPCFGAKTHSHENIFIFAESILCTGFGTNLLLCKKHLTACWHKGRRWAFSHLLIDLNRFWVLFQLSCIGSYFQKALVCWTEKEIWDISQSTHSQKLKLTSS